MVTRLSYRLRHLAGLVVICLLVPAWFVTHATPVAATSPEEWNGWSGLCMDAPGGSNGTKIHQWQCYGGKNQWWGFGTHYSDGSVSIQDYAVNRCLDVPNWSTSNGVQLQLWDCSGGTNQRYWPYWEGSTEYVFQNVNSGKCVEVYNWSKSNGAIVDQWTCGNNQLNQSWVSGQY
jgi:hypothetical protein